MISIRGTTKSQILRFFATKNGPGSDGYIDLITLKRIRKDNGGANNQVKKSEQTSNPSTDEYDSGNGPFGGYRLAFDKKSSDNLETDSSASSSKPVKPLKPVKPTKPVKPIGEGKQDFERFLSLAEIMTRKTHNLKQQAKDSVDNSAEPRASDSPAEPVSARSAKTRAASFRLEDIRTHQREMEGKHSAKSAASKLEGGSKPTLKELRDQEGMKPEEDHSIPIKPREAPTEKAAETTSGQRPGDEPSSPEPTAGPMSQSSSELPPTPQPSSSSPPQPPNDLSKVNLNNLEHALRDAKAEEAKHEAEMFRLRNAYEFARSSKSIDRGNFFTSVISDVKQEQQKARSLEYTIVTPNQKLIYSRKMPFRDQQAKRDLYGALSEISNPEKYARTIARLHRGGWTCIGGGGPGSLLVFEREYNANRRFTWLLVKLTAGTVGAVGFFVILAMILETSF